ncbi:hypothetical protein E5357_16085 [Hominisplanchenecus murintestinalis]|uniref:Uncharacterized protein n=1 Tax=Hominisplanchenecus murintestinalis TaxID=2941517 RepID=A0AC61QV17_9FIRM|nr:toxin glutamine deamidase domain-containing protein [Hominisplanchenecus murintestinalis]TGX96444.1 hypothetical protein E5357_16085 [Hominisplanchenecus murintestinalis]
MARYAINEESIDLLKGLSQKISSSMDGIITVNNALKNQIISIMDDLGIYGFEILEIILHVNDACQSCNDDIELLSEKLNQKSAEIEQLFVLTDSSSGGNLGVSKGNGKVQTVENIASWIGSVNPHYHDSNYNPWDNPYRVNCGSCALNVERRFNGDNDAVASINNIGTDAGMEQATGKKCVYMSLDNIEKALIDQGPGSHMIIGINRKPTLFGRTQAGHWFNAYYDGQNIYTIDGQSGQILEWPYDYGDISEYCAMI